MGFLELRAFFKFCTGDDKMQTIQEHFPEQNILSSNTRMKLIQRAGPLSGQQLQTRFKFNPGMDK